jgi:hypothetical protein
VPKGTHVGKLSASAVPAESFLHYFAGGEQLSNFDSYSGTITSSAGPDTNLVLADCQNNSGVYIWLQGTYAGITVTLEGSADGGTTWNAVAAYPLNVPGAATSSMVLATNSFNHVYAMVGAAKKFRVRATAFTSGSLQVLMCAVTDADPILSSAATSTAAAALQDTTTNPTAGGSAAYDFMYNGTQWDRVRSNVGSIALDLTGARTVTGTGVTAVNYNHAGAIIGINVTGAPTGTSPTAVFKVQFSTDGGTNWADLDATNAATASITAAGQYYIKVYPGIPTVAAGSCNSPLPRTWRLAWTLGGTTPSFTFVSNVAYIL